MNKKDVGDLLLVVISALSYPFALLMEPIDEWRK